MLITFTSNSFDTLKPSWVMKELIARWLSKFKKHQVIEAGASFSVAKPAPFVQHESPQLSVSV